MELVLIVLLGYIVGAVPFALVIGKLFYHTDIRNHGSGNVGGANTGRVLGGKAGVAVMALDLLKVTLVVVLANCISSHPWAIALGAMGAAIGHCHSVFARFKGGKAVATLYGFLLGLWIVGEASIWIFLVPMIVYIPVLYFSKITAVAGSISAIAAIVYVICAKEPLPSIIATGVIVLLLLVRHRENYRRILKGTENKIHWM